MPPNPLPRQILAALLPTAILVTAILVTCGLTLAAEPVTSGLQPGEPIAAIFEPVNVTGPYAGEPHCLVCENGANPVAMVFARDVEPSLVRLLARLDAAVAKNRPQEMGSFAVFLNEDEGLPPKLKDLARKHSLKHVVLATDAPAGPDGFRVAPEAGVTVVLYRNYQVQVNHAFRQGELNDQAIEKILADLPKILDKPARSPSE